MARGVLNIPSNEGSFENREFIRSIRLKEDKESCRIRFLTDDDDIFFAAFHDAKFPPIFGEVCVKEEFNRECTKCDNGENVRTKWLAWVYEYTHDYTSKGDIPDDVEDYETLELGSGRKIYRVEVNDVGLMCYARGHKGSIVHFSEKYGTLLDRDYEWSRNGRAKDMETSYMLEPEDKGKLSAELKKLMSELTDLEKVAAGDTDDDEEEVGKSFERELEESPEPVQEDEDTGAPF